MGRKRKQRNSKKSRKVNRVVQRSSPTRGQDGSQHRGRRRRFRRGYVAHQEVRKYQNTTYLLIPRKPFKAVAEQVLWSCSPRDWKNSGVDALQEAAEMFIVNIFDDAAKLMAHAKRDTLIAADMQLACYFRGIKPY